MKNEITGVLKVENGGTMLSAPTSLAIHADQHLVFSPVEIPKSDHIDLWICILLISASQILLWVKK
jgi:hypothetical protein